MVNKADTVSAPELEDVLARVRSINGLAKVHVTRYSQVPQLESFLLDLHAYDGVNALDNIQAKGHSHLDPVGHTLILFQCARMCISAREPSEGESSTKA